MKRRHRSEGMRPPARHREEINRLKAELATCHAYEWRKAQMIFDQMASILGRDSDVRDGGVRMFPRACRSCRMYGHSAQRCPNYAGLEWISVEEYHPITEEECTPAEWAQICQLRQIADKADEMIKRGMGCPNGVCDACEHCTAWDTEFSKWKLDTDNGRRPAPDAPVCEDCA